MRDVLPVLTTAATLVLVGSVAELSWSDESPRRPLQGAGPSITVEQVVARAGQALLSYAEDLSLAIGVEQYAQYTGNSAFQVADRRIVVSEFALVRAKDDWLGFRDVYMVDGKPVGDRQDRLHQLFMQNRDSALQQARRISDESARYNLGVIQRNFNVPTMALFFLAPPNANRFRFRKDGEESLGGTSVWRIRYEESSGRRSFGPQWPRTCPSEAPSGSTPRPAAC